MEEILVDRELTKDERSLIKWMLEHGTSEAKDCLPQLDQARVASRCPCGCASINFEIAGKPTPNVPLQIVGDYLCGDGDELCGIFVFQQAGVLAGLEIYSCTGEYHPVKLPKPSELRTYESEGEARARVS